MSFSILISKRISKPGEIWPARSITYTLNFHQQKCSVHMIYSWTIKEKLRGMFIVKKCHDKWCGGMDFHQEWTWQHYFVSYSIAYVYDI